MQLFKFPKAMTIQRFTSGSGTYTTPSGVAYIEVELVGGGASGLAGQITAGGSVGTSGAGGNTTFGTSLLTANGAAATSGVVGGNGGTATVNSPAVTIVSQTGKRGHYPQYTNCVTSVNLFGGGGGESPFGGDGPMVYNNPGQNALANTGSGGSGGGGSGTANTYSGAGGGSGGYIKVLISGPDATYAYAVGAGGNYTAGTGNAAGNGGSGVIIVKEFYQ